MIENLIGSRIGTYIPDMKLAQIHGHTRRSDGNASPKQAVDIAKGVVNDLAITDHDTMVGAIEAWEYNDRMNNDLTLWVGEEVTSLEGDMIGLDLKRPILCHMPAEETALAIREQGGLIIIPHPEFVMANSMKWDLIDKLYRKGLVDAVELANGGALLAAYLRANPFLSPFVPEENANLEAVKSYFSRTEEDRPAKVGGMDFHMNHPDSMTGILTAYPRGLTLREGITTHQTEIVGTGRYEHITLLSYLEHKFRGWMLTRNRLNHSGDIMCVAQ